MSRITSSAQPTVVGRRMRELRESLGWAQEKVGVAIGIEESSSRARISRYELGVHEPPVATARRIAEALGVPLAYLYCEEDAIASLLLALHKQPAKERQSAAKKLTEQLQILPTFGVGIDHKSLDD